MKNSKIWLIVLIVVLAAVAIFIFMKSQGKKAEKYADYGVYDETPRYGHSGLNYNESPYGIEFSERPKQVPMNFQMAHSLGQAMRRHPSDSKAARSMNPILNEVIPMSTLQPI